MTSLSILLRSAALALTLSALPQAARSQSVVQALPGTTDADRLADEMRRIGSNPQDVNALIAAGELSVKLGDMSGAGSLFARAEKVDPRNARVKAGIASILVRSERPAEALRYFQQAEALGLSPRGFAADRGFAYDLVGEQERAQRDYRTVLMTTPDDEETLTRYALSLGISGKKDQALDKLGPLIRQSDRGAWRARAFVLAMNGDVAGASKIAATMMPPGTAQGLMPFFQRLPTLPAVDRAFAVHFGEVRPTPERLADAQLKPALPPLDPEQPTMLAATQPAPVTPAAETKRGKRDKRQAPAVAAPPVRLAQVDTTPPPPAYQAQAETIYDPLPPTVRGGVQRGPSAAALANAQALAAMKAGNPVPAPVGGTLPSRTVEQLAALPVGNGAVRANNVMPMAASPWQSVDSVGSTRQTASNSVPAAMPRPVQPVPARIASASPSVSASTTSREVRAVPYPTTTGGAGVAAVRPVTPSVAPSAGTAIAKADVSPAAAGANPEVATMPSPVQPTSVVASMPPVSSPATSTTSAPTPNPIAPVRSAAAPTGAGYAQQSRPAVRASEDSILARIVAGLPIPASELGVQGPERPAVAAVEPVSTAATEALADAQAKREAEASAAAEKQATEKLAADKLAADKIAAAKAAADKKLADRKAAEKKVADAKKALADKKAADEKKAELAEKAAEAKAAKADPSRIWVQVSGGAYEGDLPKAWAGVKAKAPDAFAGKQGWSTPLRATNRVLAGPFKTDDEARAFINTLAKKGISAFPFTSDKGQKVTKLGGK